MRISDWSSDVCSSDLRARFVAPDQAAEPMIEAGRGRDIDFGPAARPGDRQRGVLAGHVGDFSKDAGQAQGQSLIIQGASTGAGCCGAAAPVGASAETTARSEEHTSELQSLMRIP